MGSHARTIHFEKVWSPASRDPRFSRRTPDQLRARADPNSSGNPVADNTSWALGILTAKVRKTPLYDPKRAKIIEQLTTVVERVEKKRVDSARKVVIDSPAPAAPAERPQTAIFQQPQRAVFGGEPFGLGVGSPVPALGALS